jgi:hypothetical protein
MMDEGIHVLPESALCIRRNEKINQLFQLSNVHRTILICSSPTTGKTKMVQLLENYLRALERNIVGFYLLSMSSLRKTER